MAPLLNRWLAIIAREPVTWARARRVRGSSATQNTASRQPSAGDPEQRGGLGGARRQVA